MNHRGEPALATALRDVRERLASEQRIRFLAHHDMLTELPNRVLLNETLENTSRRAARSRLPMTVLCLDLDGFKLVNDTLGHAAGDRLLCQVATRLLAEACGVIIPLGEWVLRTACQSAMAWGGACRIAVNLSPAQFRRGGLRDMVATILVETGLPAERLELEITEGSLMENTPSTLRTLNDLRELGIRLVLDDFGTGYASLSYLQQFQFDKLKVDQSFVKRLETGAGSRAIVSAIIRISRELNIEVTAEGVETAAQHDLLRDQGCHELQGYLLGRPMPFQATREFMARLVEA